MEHPGKPLTPRKWQAEFVERFEKKLKLHTTQNGGQGCLSFTVNAAPGVGKTDGTLMTARRMMDTGQCDFVIIISPRGLIATGWADKARAKNRHRMNLHYGLMLPSWTDTPHGISMTIHALVTSTPYWIAAIQDRERTARNRIKVGLIIDEIHHYAELMRSSGEDELRAWARALTSLKDAIKPLWQINLSGTLFRSRKSERVSGVEYKPVDANDEEFVVVADMQYTMAEGIRDRVIRPVRFRITDGKSTWEETSGVKVSKFSEKLDAKGRSRRLSSALHSFGQRSIARRMLEIGKEELKRCRAGTTPNAAGHAIAKDVKHAKDVAKVLEDLTGRKPLLVTSQEEGDCADKVKEFAKSDDQWIVSVDMVSEGVDIPRMRVQVYLSNKLTEYYLRQAWARVQRQIDSGRDETAVVILPNDARIVEVAQRFEREVEQGCVRPEEGGGGGGGGEGFDAWTPIDSSAEGESFLYQGEFLDPDIVAAYASQAEDLNIDPSALAARMTRDMSPEELEVTKAKGRAMAKESPAVDMVKRRLELRGSVSRSIKHLTHIRFRATYGRNADTRGSDRALYQAIVSTSHAEFRPRNRDTIERCDVSELTTMDRAIKSAIVAEQAQGVAA